MHSPPEKAQGPPRNAPANKVNPARLRQAKFPEEGSNAVAGSGVDGFAELEETFLRRVANATELLKNMSANSDTVSVTEQIRARTNAHAEITAISETVRKMSELIMKEYKLKAKSKGKLSDDELLRRDQNVKVFTIKLNQLSQQLMQGRQGARNQLFESFVPKTTLDRDALFGSGNGGGGGAGNLGAAAASRAGVGMSDPGGEAMSAEQQQALAEIYRRDEEQDKMIEEIGELIQETGALPLAVSAHARGNSLLRAGG